MVLLLLAGCVQPVETRITSAGVQGTVQTSFILGTAHLPKDSASVLAQKHVVAALLAKGLTAQHDRADLQLQIGLSVRPANLSVVADESTGAGASVTIGTVSKKKRASKKCQPNEYRLVVELVSIADGNIAYAGSAAEFHCKLPVTAALPALVDAALADFGKPQGGYVLKRKALY